MKLKVKLLGLALLIFGLGLGLCGSVSVGAQKPCTLTLSPGQSIQQVINEAEEGAVICLAEGEWLEYIVIKKGLTLRGSGPEQSVIRGGAWISSPEEIQVFIENLKVTGGASGIKVLGAVKANISRSTISGNSEAGIGLFDSAQAIISGSIISGNWDGIELEDSAQATISGSIISGNRIGIELEDSAQATISGSTVSGNMHYGIWLMHSARANISGSTVSGNLVGIKLEDSARVELKESLIKDNEWCGIWVESEEAQLSGGPNEMCGNGADLCGYAPASLRKPLVPQTDRTQLSVPKDFKSLQEAVDALAPGGTITVAAGVYEEGLTIWKPLKLLGAGLGQTTLKPLPGRRLIVSIIAEALDVWLEGLKVTGSQGAGLVIYGSAKLQNIEVSGNVGSIFLEGSAQANITGSTISKNSLGIRLVGSTQATISGSTISGNWFVGIELWGSARANISGSTVSGNRGNGIWLRGSVLANITGSTISGNRVGILLEGSAQAIIEGNMILRNGLYGVALHERPCLDIHGVFEGYVAGKKNAIPGPGKPKGNKKGAVCPDELKFLMTEEGGELDRRK